MDMIERVARALSYHYHDTEDAWPAYREDVILTLEAMRDPTDAMIEAAERADWSADYSEDESTKYRSTAIFRAMIDAALAG